MPEFQVLEIKWIWMLACSLIYDLRQGHLFKKKVQLCLFLVVFVLEDASLSGVVHRLIIRGNHSIDMVIFKVSL